MPLPTNVDDFTARLRPAQDGAVTLVEERARSAIEVGPLSRYLLGDAFLRAQDRIVKLLEGEKVFSKTNQLNLSRPDRYVLGLARAKMLRRMSDKHNWSAADYDMVPIKIIRNQKHG